MIQVTKVAYAGTMNTPQDNQKFIALESVLNNIKEIEIISLREHVEEIIKNDKDNMYDLILNMSGNAIDKADVFVAYFSTTDYSSVAWMAFLMGYAWSQGVPTIAITEGIPEEELKVNYMIARVTHAHLHTMDEILNYDWETCPTYYSGKLRLV